MADEKFLNRNLIRRSYAKCAAHINALIRLVETKLYKSKCSDASELLLECTFQCTCEQRIAFRLVVVETTRR